MDTWTAVFLLSYFLFTSSVQSAPVTRLPQAFWETAGQTKTLVDKVLESVAAADSATVSTQGHSLDSSPQTSALYMMEVSLEIPAPPVLKEVSGDTFPLDTCVSHMLVGIQLYQDLLEVLSTRLSGLEDLRSDLRDLLTHVNKLKEAALLQGDGSDLKPSLDLFSQLKDSYRVQMKAHLTLAQLRSFCHDMKRTFSKLAKDFCGSGSHCLVLN